MKRLDPSSLPWMREDALLTVMRSLTGDAGEARIVGGAVRNSLLGLSVDEVDIATPLVPTEVIRRLTSAGIANVLTGIEHGTVTALVGNRPFEVTTLRRDVETDGRHAVVAFSTDWREDAARRDFTINALYASLDGEIFDYENGLEDLVSGRVRFIGDAETRIREDYLRILRFFRFHARYGKGELDSASLQAASKLKSGIANLSGERIQKEFLRLIEADNPIPTLRVMAAAQILLEIVAGPLNLARLEHLCAIDAQNFFTPDPLLRLSALLDGGEPQAQAIADRFKFSNRGRTRIEDIATTREKIVSYLSIREVRKLLYRLGQDRFKDRVFLRWAEDPKPSNAIQWRALLALADAWQKPIFPLTGRDVLIAGVPEGPLIGKILSDVEEWWIDSDFTEDEFSLAERLKAVVQATAY